MALTTGDCSDYSGDHFHNIMVPSSKVHPPKSRMNLGEDGCDRMKQREGKQHLCSTNSFVRLHVHNVQFQCSPPNRDCYELKRCTSTSRAVVLLPDFTWHISGHVFPFEARVLFPFIMFGLTVMARHSFCLRSDAIKVQNHLRPKYFVSGMAI